MRLCVIILRNRKYLLEDFRVRDVRDEREEQRGPRKRRRKRNPKVIPVLIAFLLIIAIVGFIAGKFLYEKYSPSKEPADTAAYFQLEDKQDMAIIMNEELLTQKARFIDGKIYLHVETVYEYLSERFYWDAAENLYLYALPKELVSVEVGKSEYSIGKSKQSEDYVILKADGTDAYVALDFVKKYTNFSYEYWEDPNHVRIVTEFGEREIVFARKATAVREAAGIKIPILTTAEKGSMLYVLPNTDGFEEWTKVLSMDGYIGYVQNKYLSETSQISVEEPEFEEVEYSSISKDYTINLTWHQVTNMEANNQLLNKIAGTKGLTTISPTWFSVSDTSGNITSLASHDYVDYAHQQGLEVWALVDDFKEDVSIYETLSKTSSRQRLVNQLTAAAIQYGLDGINIDFEHITQDGSRAYLQFIRELSIMCRINGIVLSVDNYVPTYTAHYGREEQGVFVDYLIIMGYDEHYAGSEVAGSVASYDFVKDGIERTLEEVPCEKVINAIPFYTRFWKTDVEGNVSSTALGIQSAEDRLKANEVTANWDENTHQYYAEFEYENSIYQMWLEEERSIEEKLLLMKEYELAGVASWKLGLERSSVWDVILKYVN